MFPVKSLAANVLGSFFYRIHAVRVFTFVGIQIAVVRAEIYRAVRLIIIPGGLVKYIVLKQRICAVDGDGLQGCTVGKSIRIDFGKRCGQGNGSELRTAAERRAADGF